MRERMKGKPRVTSNESRRAWDARNPEKVRAHRVVLNEIRQGRLVRPESCEECGNVPGQNRIGHPLIHAHHDDYNQPREVKWLCVDCHRRMNRIEVSDALVDQDAR